MTATTTTETAQDVRAAMQGYRASAKPIPTYLGSSVRQGNDIAVETMTVVYETICCGKDLTYAEISFLSDALFSLRRGQKG